MRHWRRTRKLLRTHSAASSLTDGIIPQHTPRSRFATFCRSAGLCSHLGLCCIMTFRCTHAYCAETSLRRALSCSFWRGRWRTGRVRVCHHCYTRAICAAFCLSLRARACRFWRLPHGILTYTTGPFLPLTRHSFHSTTVPSVLPSPALHLVDVVPSWNAGYVYALTRLKEHLGRT